MKHKKMPPPNVWNPRQYDKVIFNSMKTNNYFSKPMEIILLNMLFTITLPAKAEPSTKLRILKNNV